MLPRKFLVSASENFLVASDLSCGCPFPLTGQKKGWEVNPWLGGMGITRALLCVNLPLLSMDVLLETVFLGFICHVSHKTCLILDESVKP